MEQLGHKQVLVWDAGNTGSDFTHYDTPISHLESRVPSEALSPVCGLPTELLNSRSHFDVVLRELGYMNTDVGVTEPTGR